MVLPLYLTFVILFLLTRFFFPKIMQRGKHVINIFESYFYSISFGLIYIFFVSSCIFLINVVNLNY